MDTALDQLHDGTVAVRDVDIAVVSVDELQAGVLRLQTVLNHVQVTQARWLHELDTRAAFAMSGDRNAAAWLVRKGRTATGAARAQAELGRAMSQTPQLADAVASGDLSPAAAAMLLPTLVSEHSGDIATLLDDCAGATPVQARAAGARFRELNPPAGSTPRDREHALRQRRALTFCDNGDGTTDIHGTLTTSDACTVQQALRAIIGKPTDGDDRTPEQKLADALVQLCDAYARGEVRGGRGSAPVILVTVDLFDLINQTGYGMSSTGQVFTIDAVRRMTANAHLQRVLLADSVVLDEGRRVRLATDDQHRALTARDGGCRFPGCTIPAEWCQADHIREWDADHGPTDIDWLVLWCVYHHHFRHRPDVTVHGNANNLSITLPDGRTMPLPARGPTRTEKPAA